MSKNYRSGPIGALADEYEKALIELKEVLLSIDEGSFSRILNPNVDPTFQSVNNILIHVVNSGYVYANYIRKRFGNPFHHFEIKIKSQTDAFKALDLMFDYTLKTFEDKWHLTDEDLMQTLIKTSWTTYDLEALIEHAIVHILRHRRQIQKMIDH